MFDFPILEVAIGLTSVYLLLSLVCSTLTELIARACAMRSNNLKDGVENLLKDPNGALFNNKELIEQFFEHPLIDRLSKQGRFDRWLNRESYPSYISSDIFARALIDIVLLKNPGKNFEETVSSLGDSDIKRLLLSVTREGGNDITEVKKSIEIWFNESMDRISGWYARKAQLITLFLALGIVLFLNVDSVMIANSLSQDAILRKSIVGAAEEYLKNSRPNEIEDRLRKLENLKRLNLPIGWTFELASEQPGRILDLFRNAAHKITPGKIVGLLLTAIAVAIGAPFWFDVLNKLVNIRATGKKPETES